MTELREPVYALLTDGAEIQIRPLGSEDEEAVRVLHRGLSRDSLYLRFFSFSSHAADQIASRLCRPSDPAHAALGV